MGVVASVPLVHGLVETVDPVGSSGEVDDLLLRDVVGNKLGDGVADEHVRLPDVAPEVVPDVVLGRALNGNEVTSHLDVRSVEDGAVGGDLLDQGDETGHLRIIDLFHCQLQSLFSLQSCPYKDDVGTTLLRGAERTTLGEPVSVGVVLNPVGDGGLLRVRDSLVGVADTLEDVVLVLGDSENTRSGLGNCLSVRVLPNSV